MQFHYVCPLEGNDGHHNGQYDIVPRQELGHQALQYFSTGDWYVTSMICWLGLCAGLDQLSAAGLSPSCLLSSPDVSISWPCCCSAESLGLLDAVPPLGNCGKAPDVLMRGVTACATQLAARAGGGGGWGRTRSHLDALTFRWRRLGSEAFSIRSSGKACGTAEAMSTHMHVHIHTAMIARDDRK